MTMLGILRAIGVTTILIAVGMIIASGFLLDASIHFYYDLIYYPGHDPYLEWAFFEIAYKLIGTSAVGVFLSVLQIIVSALLVAGPRKFGFVWICVHVFIFVACIICFAVAISCPPADGVKVQAFCGLLGLNFCCLIILMIIAVFAVYVNSSRDELYVVKN